MSTIVLTPNRRLAAALKKRDEKKISQTHDAWETITTLPLTSWITQLAQQFFAKSMDSHQLILTSEQESLIWEEIIRQSKYGSTLLNLSDTATLAKSAWGLLKAWQINLSHASFASSENHVLFQEWATIFKKKLQQHHWLDTHSLIDFIAEKISARLIVPPQEIILVGFHDLSPQYQTFFSACVAAGCQVEHESSTSINQTHCRIALVDDQAEILSMAKWAKDLVQNKSTKIACIVPDLNVKRERVAQVFSEVLQENHLFNISAGLSLAQCPVIHTALKLLHLYDDSIPVETLIYFLRSPFLGDAEKEKNERAHFENILRQRNILTTSVKHLIHDCALEKYCPRLAKKIIHVLKNNSLPTSFEHWATFFSEHLTALGWPGERSLNSIEYQAIKRFLDVLSELSHYDHLLPAPNFASALSLITRLTHDTIFQPQTTDAPIQILGLLEALDLSFDHMWIMGLDDAAWPPPARPNPFIPFSLQKKLRMPHADAERELAYATQLMQQLQHNTQHLICSYAKKNAGTEQQPSPLITHFPEIDITTLPQAEFISSAEIIYAKKNLQSLLDEVAPPITSLDELRGGTHIFKQQAACPFKAFAEYRLHARAVDKPVIGLTMQERGKIMHKSLELFWQVVKNSENLLKLSHDSLITILNDAVTTAVLAITQKTAMESRYLTLESERLKKILHQWILKEKNRPPFKVISQETEQSLQIANLTLTLRIDRIDEVCNGEILIIDYKTGKNITIQDWFGDRPEEPQLLLYALIDPDKTVGIAFGQLHADNIALKGLCKNDLGISTIKMLQHTSWEAQTSEWKKVLEHLAEQFLQGHAAADPKDPLKNCTICKLHTLCRIHEESHHV